MANRIKIDCISEGCQIIKNRINRILNLDSQAFELRLELTPPPFLGLQFADGRLWDFSDLIIMWSNTFNKIFYIQPHQKPQARLQQYVNCELTDIQAGFRKGRGTRDQIANICWIMEKVWEFQKNIYFCFIEYFKAFCCVDHNKLWNILKEMEIPDHLTCLLRNLYAGQEATVRTGHGTTDWFQIGK